MAPTPSPRCGRVIAGPSSVCRGVCLPGYASCLAHATNAERASYFAALVPGADVDHRSTPFSEILLSELLHALWDPALQAPISGNAWFTAAHFDEVALFAATQFGGVAEFSGAQFSSDVQFSSAQFIDVARFTGVRFASDIDFTGVRFDSDAQFSGALFVDSARFTGARFVGDANFSGALFSGGVGFSEVRFSENVDFSGSAFRGAATFEEACVRGRADFSMARFNKAFFDTALFDGGANFSGVEFMDMVKFDNAQFKGASSFQDVRFRCVIVASVASFAGAEFSRDVSFSVARFNGAAKFSEVQFNGAVMFDGAQFKRSVDFKSAHFERDVEFGNVKFSSVAGFCEVHFGGNVGFGGVLFPKSVDFSWARFSGASTLGPMVCWGKVDLSGSAFEQPIAIQVSSRRLLCVRTKWESTAAIRVRYARMDLTDAVLSAPVAVASHPVPFANTNGQTVNDFLLAGEAGEDRVKVVSVQGVDAAHLTLIDADLRDCLFTNAFHLDQISLDGRTTFAPVPTGIRSRAWPARWSKRRTLAEEHHWRALDAGQTLPPVGQQPSDRLWRPGPHHPDSARTPDPKDVAAVYRQLRKAFEDSKNEPGAADFYYGEMEMRRRDRVDTSRAERGLLHGYWLLSGYGLRSSRAVAWLLAAMSLTVFLLMGFGVPTHDPSSASRGTISRGRIAVTTSSPEPMLNDGWIERLTWTRTERATRVAVNSVIFRASGQNLTTVGTYIEMTSRLLEPTLLVLAVIAVRGRIKR